MRATLLRTCLPALALAVVATGCNKPPQTCDGGPTVTFLMPTDGETLDTANSPAHVDLDAGTLGIAVQVQTFCAAVGSPVTISLDGTPLDGGALITTSSGTATVPGIVNLTGDYNGIHHTFGAKLTDSGGKGVATGSAAVTVVLPPPQDELTIIQPKDGAILNSLVDLNETVPGLQTQVNFSQTASLGSPINLCSTVAPPGSTQGCPFGSGSAFFVDQTLSSPGTSLVIATLSDGIQTLTASILDRLSDAGANASVNIEVHTQRPIVTSFTISGGFVDDAGGHWLNSLNSDGGIAFGSATVVFGPPDTAIDDAGAQILNALTKRPIFSSGPLGGATTALVPLSLPDGIYPLEVQAHDVWGNPVSDPSLIPVTTSPDAGLTLGVKTSLPTCAIQGPTGYWNVLKNDGGATPGTVTLPVQIATTNAGATDLAGQPIAGTASVSVNNLVATSQAVTAASFTAGVSAPQGVATLLATITDPAGNPPGTCPGSVTVDTIPPTISLVPANPDSMVGGIPTYTSSNNVTVTVTTDAPAGQPISIFVASGSGAPSLWIVAPGGGTTTQVTLPALPQGPAALTAQVTDLAGNVGTTVSPAQVSVAAPGFCSVYISYPPSNQVIGVGSGADAGPNAITVPFTVQTFDSACFADTVTLTLTPGTGIPIVVTLPLDATGKAIFPTTLADTDTGTYFATIADGHGSSTPTFSYEVKLSTPAITDGGVSPGASSLEIVAAAGNPNVGTTLATGALVLANGAPDVAHAHANFQVSVTGLGPKDPISGNYGSATLQIAFPPPAVTVDPTPITITSDTATVSFVDVLLPAHEAGGTVTLTVFDNATNHVPYTWNVATDVIPPGAPNPTTTITDAHAANIALSWNATGDDDLGGGPVTSYDLRWSTVSNPANDDQFFDGGMRVGPNPPAGDPVGTPKTYGLNVPPLNDYFVALRAVDAVGNRSPFAPATAVADPWKTMTLTAPAPTNDTAFGFRVESGDFNGDGATDLVISDSYYSGSGGGDLADGGLVYVLPGQKNDPDLSKLSLSNATVLFSAGIGNHFGYDLAVGDFNADGTKDLAIGAYASNGGQGLVAIYFGGPNGISGGAPDVTITGATGAAAQFGRTVRTLKGVGATGDALFIGEPGTLGGATNAGAGYVFFAKGQAAWNALGNPATSANADTTITGASGDTFGFRWGAVGVGDINSDGKADCILPATGAGKVYGFSGATLAGAGALTTAANALFSQPGPMPFQDGATNFWDAFGTSAVSDAFTKGANQDVVIGDAIHNTTTLFTTAANGLTSVTALSGTGRFGWVASSADINKDGFADLLVGRNDTAVGAVDVFLNTKASPFFNQTPDATLADAANPALGISVSTGFYGGAGNGLSIASGTAFSNVLIYYVNPPP